ncbi:MAG: DMT family transporter [Bacteroidetes bacterium]|nr:MAG: DMT family transporter [Bacteroidota bacterium]
MNNKTISWLIFVVLCFIWGSSFILMKLGKNGLSASQIAALRIFSAGVVLLPFAIYALTKFPRKKLVYTLLAGLLGNLLPAFLFAEAISKNIDSSLGGILNSLTPICVVITGVVFFKDVIKQKKIIGVIVGFIGLVILTLSQKGLSFQNSAYALMIVLATILYGFNVNIVAHKLKKLNPVHIATISLSFMAIPSGIILLLNGFFELDFTDKIVRNSVIASSLLGIVASAIATALFYILVRRSGGLFASLVTYGIPFIALFWGFLDGEKITWIEIACLGLILAGVYLANMPDKKGKIDENDTISIAPE